jgi:hypothetical protein
MVGLQRISFGCGGGGCDDSEVEVMWGCGVEVLTQRCWIWRRRGFC